jgi:hypothetical protein
MRNSLAAASVAIACAMAPAFGEDFGTLFTTPKERSDLERLRRGESIAPGASALPPHEAVITGYVKRSDGKSTVFIDQQPRPVRDAKLQERLVPRVVQRYIPPPPPTPAPAAKADD